MSKKTVKPEVKSNRFEGYDYSSQESLAIERCDRANSLGNEHISAILTAYFDKNLSLQDLEDVFHLPQVVLQLVIAPREEYEF